MWNEVLKYQAVLSHPLLEEHEYIVFTPLYWDWFGLGMMTTISTPVFGGRNTTASEPRLLGVASVDIRISQLEELYPWNQFRGFGYGFAINNNGLFLMHPKLHGQVRDYT